MPNLDTIWIVAVNDIRRMLRTRIVYLYALIMLAAASSYFLAYNRIISDLIKQHASTQALRDTTRTYLNTTFCIWPLLFCLANALNVGSNNLTLEKTARSLEPLMVTPLSLRQIWIGKSLGLSIVAVLMGLGEALVVFLGTSFFLVVPKTGAFVRPDAIAILTALIVIPVLIFMAVMLTTYLQLLVTNPRAATGAFATLMVAMWIGLTFVTYYLRSNTDYFTPIYIALIAVAFTASRVAARSLTPEKVVLSSKG